MPYIGRSTDGFGVRNRFLYLASASDTSVSGADANGATLTFTDGAYVDVYLNGVLLKAGTDYNTNTANTIAGLSALASNDEVTVIVYDVFTVGDMVSATSGGTFTGNVTHNGTVTFGSTVSGLDVNGTEIILDADGDTTITADTDDTIDIKIGGSDIFQMTASKLDLNGKELVLDADADTSITADTDDQIDFKTGGTDRMSIKSTGQIFIGNTSGTLPSGTMGVTQAGRHIIANDGAGYLLLQDNSTAAQNNGFDIHMGGVPAGTATLFSGGSIGGFVENASDADGYLKFSTSVNGTITEAMRINSDGNLVIAQSGKGIDFSAVSTSGTGTVASSILDDYEEGVFTYNSNANIGFNTDTNVGRYTKIGNMVHVQIYVDVSSVSSTNHFYLSGMPFTAGANTTSTYNGNSTGTCMIYNLNTYYSGAQFNSNIGNGSTNMYFYESYDNVNWSIVTNSRINSSTEMIISHTYFV